VAASAGQVEAAEAAPDAGGDPRIGTKNG